MYYTPEAFATSKMERFLIKFMYSFYHEWEVIHVQITGELVIIHFLWKEKPSHRQQAFQKIPAILLLMGSKSVKFSKVRSEILKQNNEKYISELKRA